MACTLKIPYDVKLTIPVHNQPFLIRHILLALIQAQLKKTPYLACGKRLHPPAAAVFFGGVNRI